MKVVILCGGKGTRLREETEYRPKPMLPIGDRPILWHIMKIYSAYGFTDFILCLGYKGEVIRDYFRNYLWQAGDVTINTELNRNPIFHHPPEDSPWTITLADTGLETLTAGRIRKIRPYLGTDEHFLLTYGDGVGNVDIRAGLDLHLKSNRILTLTAVHPPGRFGEVSFDAEGTVSHFNEKPQAEGGWINGGFFCASTRLFDYLPEQEEVLLEKDPMQKLASQGELQAFPHSGFWQPMDTYQEFLYLNHLWDTQQAPWKIW